MNTIVRVSDTIRVNIYPQPKKKLSKPGTYDIYLLHTVTQNGIPQSTTAITTNISIAVKEWGSKEVAGRSERARQINAKLHEHMQTAHFALEALRPGNIQSCAVVKNEILSTVKMKVTGRAPRGQKIALCNQMKLRTVDVVLEDLLTFRKPAEMRQRIYRHAVKIFHHYFLEKTPLITQIAEQDLTDFHTWLHTEYKCVVGARKGLAPAPNTCNTWLTMIAAVFVHAHKKMKILPVLPIPAGFRGCYVPAERIVLSERECLSIIQLDDQRLSPALKRSKHCLILGLLTAMQYCDIKALTSEHVIYDSELEQWYIRKPREKTGVIFTVFLTPRAKASFDRLRELSPGSETLFRLPSLNCTNTQYKKIATQAAVSTKVTSYILRHTFAVDNMDHGTPTEDIQDNLGHKDQRHTRIYAKVSRTRLHGNSKILVQRSAMHQL